MAENTQVAEKRKLDSALSQWSNEMTGLIARDYESCGVQFDDYSKKCAMEAMASIYNLVKSDDKASMANMDTSNLRSIVEQCASLKLNASAYPRECYFQLRNIKVGNEWKKTVEMGIEGAGYDSLLANYGKDVAQVYPYWVIKEGDTYVPPRHKGLELTPPEWEEKGLSDKAIKVIYPVKLKDGTVTYLTADRSSVKVNLLAHVKQNMMNATFGICADRYKATDKQKEDIKAKKEEILNRNRCFMVSILGDYSFTFPNPIELQKVMKDYLEDEVDEKYYINNEKAQKLIQKLIDNGTLSNTIAQSRAEQSRAEQSRAEQSRAEQKCVDGTINEPKEKQVGNCIKAKYDAGISNLRSDGNLVAESVC